MEPCKKTKIAYTLSFLSFSFMFIKWLILVLYLYRAVLNRALTHSDLTLIHDPALTHSDPLSATLIHFDPTQQCYVQITS